MTRTAVPSHVERVVGWVDVAMLVSGFVFSAMLSKAFLFPSPEDHHGGGYQLMGVLVLVPALSGVFVAWLSLRRRERWRWWAHLLPFVIFYVIAALFDSGLYDSAWQIPLFVGVPWFVAASYALFWKSHAG